MRVLIVGAGISGLSVAIALKKIGLDPKIIEKHPCLRSDGAGIALPLNAVAALSNLGLHNALMRVAYQVKSITYSLPSGEILSQASLEEGNLNQYPFVALHRKNLIRLLATAAETKIEFNKEISDIKFNEGATQTTTILFNDGNSETFDLIIACDGINSSLRRKLIKTELREDLGLSTWRFITKFKQDNPIYYLGEKSAFMVYPISTTEAYCYAHIYDISKKSEAEKDYLSLIFREYPPMVNSLIKSSLQEDITFGRIVSISKPIFYHQNIAFVGDAAHACSPMLQQGAASALEDAITLSLTLKHCSSIDESLNLYEKLRFPRFEWIREHSDAPIKAMSSCILDADYQKRNEFIRKNGPTNVMKWRSLFSTDYLASLQNHISYLSII